MAIMYGERGNRSNEWREDRPMRCVSVGETHGGEPPAEGGARYRRRGELGVGDRQEDDVTRGLTEVDDGRLGLEEMHGSGGREMVV